LQAVLLLQFQLSKKHFVQEHMRDHFQTKALIQQMKGSWEDFAMGLVQLAMDLNFAMGLVQLAMGLVQLAMDLAQLQHFRKHLHLACQNPDPRCAP